jgi:hypothetical protein
VTRKAIGRTRETNTSVSVRRGASTTEEKEEYRGLETRLGPCAPRRDPGTGSAPTRYRSGRVRGAADLGLAVRAYSGLRLAERHPVVHNLVISNAPPPLYFMGARFEALHPLGPVFHGAGRHITVMSTGAASASGSSPTASRCPASTPWPDGSSKSLVRLRKVVVADRPPVPPITQAKCKGPKA